jgi:hypothetical protein
MGILAGLDAIALARVHPSETPTIEPERTLAMPRNAATSVSRLAVPLSFALCLGAAPTAEAETAPTSEFLSIGGHYRVAIATRPDPIPLNAPFELLVTLRGRTKESVPGNLELAVDAGMLAHNHGMFLRPTVAPLRAGQFRVEGMLFHMTGEWRLTLTIRRGIMTDKAETDLVLQ